MTRLFLAVCLCVLPASRGLADAKKSPLSGKITVDAENVLYYDSGIDNQVLLEAEGDLKLSVTDGISLSTDVELEQIDDPDKSGFYVVPGEGISLNSLLLNYDDKRFGFFGGHYEPNVYSSDFTYLPTLWPTDLLEDDVEITDAVGFGGHVDMHDDRLGTHRLEGGVYTSDTSVLSETLITNDGGIKLSDGGVGNTGSLESFVVALHGGGISGLDGVSYHIGFTRQKADLIFHSDGTVATDIADEYRLRTTLQKRFKISDKVTLTSLGDYIHFWNSEGFAGASRDYLSGEAVLGYGNWTLTLAATGGWINNEDGASYTDYEVDAEGAYSFGSGLSVNLSWRDQRADGDLDKEFTLEVEKVIKF